MPRRPGGDPARAHRRPGWWPWLTRARPPQRSASTTAAYSRSSLGHREGEIGSSPMERVKPPLVPEQPVAVLTEAQIEALLRACGGTAFEDRRAEAIVRLLLDTGIRRGECAGLTIDDIDLDQNVAVVLSKGRRQRACPYFLTRAPRRPRNYSHTSSHQRASIGSRSAVASEYGPDSGSDPYIGSGEAAYPARPELRAWAARRLAGQTIGR